MPVRDCVTAHARAAAVELATNEHTVLHFTPDLLDRCHCLPQGQLLNEQWAGLGAPLRALAADG